VPGAPAASQQATRTRGSPPPFIPLTHPSNTLSPHSQPHTDSTHAPFLATASLHARVHPRGAGASSEGTCRRTAGGRLRGGTPHHCLASDLLLSHSASDTNQARQGSTLFASFVAAYFRAFWTQPIPAHHPGDAAAPETAAVEDSEV
jgi:hypothetical protein